MTEEQKKSRGRPALPPDEKREEIRIYVRKKYHAELAALGGDWIEALLSWGLTREQWARVLKVDLPEPGTKE
jgi:hypothetical protein